MDDVRHVRLVVEDFHDLRSGLVHAVHDDLAALHVALYQVVHAIRVLALTVRLELLQHVREFVENLAFDLAQVFHLSAQVVDFPSIDLLHDMRLVREIHHSRRAFLTRLYVRVTLEVIVRRLPVLLVAVKQVAGSRLFDDYLRGLGVLFIAARYHTRVVVVGRLESFVRTHLLLALLRGQLLIAGCVILQLLIVGMVLAQGLLVLRDGRIFN